VTVFARTPSCVAKSSAPVARAETCIHNYKFLIMLSTAIWHPPVIDHLGLTPRCAEGREGGSWCEANAIDRA